MDYKHEEIKKLVESELSCSAHNMDHVMRVCNLCIYLSGFEESADMDILIPAALLHDIARVREDEDSTGMIDHAEMGAYMALEILASLGYEASKIEVIGECIRTHRFRSGMEPKRIEAKILFDADKLDVLGAVGIARSFMLAGQYGQNIYLDTDIVGYLKDNTLDGRVKEIEKHAPNIEYETKFRKVPDRLYTKKAKEIAWERLKFMESYFDRLRQEINGSL